VLLCDVGKDKSRCVLSAKLQFIKADVTGVDPDAPDGLTNGTVTFTELNTVDNDGVTLGDEWQPGAD